jgi:hypothetical protein
MMIVKVHDRFTIGSREDPWSECSPWVPAANRSTTARGQHFLYDAPAFLHTAEALRVRSSQEGPISRAL